MNDNPLLKYFFIINFSEVGFFIIYIYYINCLYFW